MTAQEPDPERRDLLRILATALDPSLSRPPVWPGYAAASRTVLAYSPGRWAVLANPPGPPSGGWEPYPDDWPPLPVPAAVRRDGVDGLVGQLAFDHPVPGGRTVAVPLYDSIPGDLGARNRYLYELLTHEAFHQYQRERFGDADTPSEEPYPILDVRNGALATLEMRALEDAMTALGLGDRKTARLRAETGIAVHRERWGALAPRARAMEVGKEVVEGTAKYVEVRSVARLARRCRDGARGVASPSLCPLVRDRSAPELVARDLAARMERGAVSPRDMPRNRIYPVGSALGLLLDAFQPGWKLRLQEAGTARGLHERLDAALSPLSRDADALARSAMERYGWTEILAASRELVESYRTGFRRALRRFRASSGLRVEVELPDSGLSRSRASRQRRWVVGRGDQILGRFVAYALRRTTEPRLRLSVRDRSVLEERLGNARKRVVFFVNRLDALVLDGRGAPPEGSLRRQFGRMTLSAGGVELESRLGGTVERSAGTLRVQIFEGAGARKDR